MEARERKCQVLLPRLDPSEIDRSDHNDSGSFAKSGNRQRAKVGTKKKSDPILQVSYFLSNFCNFHLQIQTFDHRTIVMTKTSL